MPGHPSGNSRNTSPQISVLVVAYNSRRHISGCIQSVFSAATGIPTEVLLIDNGTDDTAGFVTANFPNVVVIPSRGNIGFGAGNNELARHARAPFLLLVNPDMVLKDSAIQQLLAVSREKPNAAAWGGVTLSEDGYADVANHLRFPNLRQLIARLLFRGDRAAEPSSILGMEPARVEMVSGGLMMVSREVWDKIGGFDESFFLYAEESDFFMRTRETGRQVWRNPHAQAIHFTGSGDNLSASRLLYQATGLLQFMHKHWPAPKAWLGALLFWLLACERYVLGLLFGRFSPSARTIGTAYSLVARNPRWWMNGYASAYWIRRLESPRGHLRK